MDNDHWSDEPLDLGVRGTFKQNHDTENTQRGAERNSLSWSRTCTCFSWWCPCFCAGPMPPIPSFFKDDWHGFSLGSSYWISKQGLGGPIKDDHTTSTWNPESGISGNWFSLKGHGHVWVLECLFSYRAAGDLGSVKISRAWVMIICHPTSRESWKLGTCMELGRWPRHGYPIAQFVRPGDPEARPNHCGLERG